MFVKGCKIETNFTDLAFAAAGARRSCSAMVCKDLNPSRQPELIRRARKPDFAVNRSQNKPQ